MIDRCALAKKHFRSQYFVSAADLKLFILWRSKIILADCFDLLGNVNYLEIFWEHFVNTRTIEKEYGNMKISYHSIFLLGAGTTECFRMFHSLS